MLIQIKIDSLTDLYVAKITGIKEFVLSRVDVKVKSEKLKLTLIKWEFISVFEYMRNVIASSSFYRFMKYCDKWNFKGKKLTNGFFFK